MKCVRCQSEHTTFNGRYRNGAQRYKCSDCKKQFSELTFRKFYRHRFPPQIIKIAIFFHLFIPAKIVQIFVFFLFRCYVSKKTICSWTRKFLDAAPEIKFPCTPPPIRYTDEKQIKIKDKKAWWWNIVEGKSNPLTSCISLTRHGFIANNLMNAHKKIYGFPAIMVTDKLQAYLQAVKKLGRRCKHIRAGIIPRMVMYKDALLIVSNLPVERLHSKIDSYIDMKFRGSFENLESANRWRKAFMMITYLQETLASQRSLGTFSTAMDEHFNMREVSVPVT